MSLDRIDFSVDAEDCSIRPSEGSQDEEIRIDIQQANCCAVLSSIYHSIGKKRFISEMKSILKNERKEDNKDDLFSWKGI